MQGLEYKNDGAIARPSVTIANASNAFSNAIGTIDYDTFLGLKFIKRTTLKKYLHLIRNPFEHNLPSNSGDQLCHAVLKPRSIKPMKANKYSNSYQMHEQRGCFNGIDTCSITSVGDFSCREPVLDEHEALSITHRSDTMSLLQKLEKERVLCVGKADEMKKDALSQIAGLDVSKFWHGSTFISMEDAI